MGFYTITSRISSWGNRIGLLFVCVGSWNLRCAPLQQYRVTLCTIHLPCAPWCLRGTYSHVTSQYDSITYCDVMTSRDDVMTSCDVTVRRNDVMWRHGTTLWRHVTSQYDVMTSCDATVWRHDIVWCHDTDDIIDEFWGKMTAEYMTRETFECWSIFVACENIPPSDSKDELPFWSYISTWKKFRLFNQVNL